MTSAFTKAKRRRASRKNVISNNLLPDVEKRLGTPFVAELFPDATSVLNSLTENHKKVREFDEIIADMIQDDDELYADELEANHFDKNIKKAEEQLRAFLRKHDDDKGSIATASSNKVVGLKLPKIIIEPFDGDPIKWKPFIEQFDATVDAKEGITDI
jgi:hypothetical protein